MGVTRGTSAVSPRSARSIPHRTGRLVAVTGPSSGSRSATSVAVDRS